MAEHTSPITVDTPERLYTAMAAAAITPSDTNPLMAKKARITDHNGILFEAAATGTGGNAVTVDFNLPTNETTSNTIGVVSNAVTVTLKATGTKAILENQGVRYESILKGAGANDIRIRLVDPASPSSALAITETSDDITVSLATDAGVNQVETATVVGTIGAAGAGNATVVVTSTGMTGSPITLNVAVANNDTASQVATKIRTALNANANITALFTIGGSAADITLTKTVATANIANLNVSIDNGTCTGLTAAPTSTSTTAGVAPAITTTRAQLVAAINSDADSNDLVVAYANAENPLYIMQPVTYTALSGGSVKSNVTVTEIVAALNADSSFAALATASVESDTLSAGYAQPGAQVQLAGGAAGQWSLDYNFTRAISVNADGNLVYLPFNGGSAVTVAVKAGVQYPLNVRGINSTNTTATGITGYV